jgi:hypothetical protein
MTILTSKRLEKFINDSLADLDRVQRHSRNIAHIPTYSKQGCKVRTLDSVDYAGRVLHQHITLEGGK